MGNAVKSMEVKKQDDDDSGSKQEIKKLLMALKDKDQQINAKVVENCNLKDIIDKLKVDEKKLKNKSEMLQDKLESKEL